MLGWGGTDPAADLGSGHRRERVGGSENGLVVHQGLVGHHRHAAHLTHLGGHLGGREGTFRGAQAGVATPCCPDSPFRTQALVVC